LDVCGEDGELVSLTSQVPLILPSRDVIAWGSENVAVSTSDVETCSQLPCTVASLTDEVVMLSTASRNDRRSGRERPELSKGFISIVPFIDIYNNQSVSSRDSHVRIRPSSPPRRDLVELGGGVLEAVRGPRMLSGGGTSITT
jgi:hypothetical protein